MNDTKHKEKERGCIKCGERATETLRLSISGRIVKEEYYCIKHWVENEGEGCLEGDLIAMDNFKEYDMDKQMAQEIIKQFPKLAKKYKHVLDKVKAYKSKSFSD